MMTTTLKTSTAPMSAHHHGAAGGGQCNSASCNSPHRLWRTLQTMIQNHSDAKDDFVRLSRRTPTDVLVRVLLTSRVSNDPALYSPSQKSRVVQFPREVRPEAVRKFGKSATDLNAVQLALVTHGTSTMAALILQFLHNHASAAECRQFVNHIWGQGNTTLHLACFWNMPRLVRLLLDMGADLRENARAMCPRDCSSSPSVLALMPPSKRSPTVETAASALPSPPPQPCLPSPPPTPVAAPPAPRPSMLLKKAAEKQRGLAYYASAAAAAAAPVVATVQAEYFQKSPLPPMTPPATPTTPVDAKFMTFSSSTSSSSSFSSLSSVEEKDDHCWTPPPSPIARHPWSPAPSPSPMAPSPCPVVDDADADADADADDDDDDDDMLPPDVRPSCVPANPIATPKQVVKQVRFDPHIMLVDACIRGDLQELKLHLIGHDDSTAGVGGIRNRSLLQIALMRGHENLVRYLADHVDVNHQDSDGWTAMHYAAALGLWRSLEYLVGLPGVDVNARSHNGLMIHDCVQTQVAQRRCRSIIERRRRAITPKC